MPITLGAKRRWRMDLDRSDRHPSGPDYGRHENQSAVCVDRDCTGALVKPIALRRIAVDEERNLDVEPGCSPTLGSFGATCASSCSVRVVEARQFGPLRRSE